MTFILSQIEIQLSQNGIDIESVFQLFRAVLGITFLIVAPAWLSRRATIAFTEYNCFFCESIVVAVKELTMYFYLLPIIGKYFDAKSQQNQPAPVRKIDPQTRFDD